MHRWAPDRSARHSTSNAVAASLLLSIALVSGGAAALTARAAAEVTADRAPKVRTAADPRAVARLAGTEHGFAQWPLTARV